MRKMLLTAALFAVILIPSNEAKADVDINIQLGFPGFVQPYYGYDCYWGPYGCGNGYFYGGRKYYGHKKYHGGYKYYRNKKWHKYHKNRY